MTDTSFVARVIICAFVIFVFRYCGWHSYDIYASTYIKYSFVGNPKSRCPTGCAHQMIGPNGDDFSDAVLSVMAVR
jgi:hypothetical protein